MSGATPGRAAFELAFQLSPVVLVGGLANDIPGQMLPVMALTQPLEFIDGLFSGGSDVGAGSFFANFHPMAGATLFDYAVGEYPFANQSVAANSVIARPTVLSLLMTCPARGFFGYAVKLMTMTALVAALQQHIQLGGTFTIMTPSRIFTNGLLLALRDVSGGESKQAQNVWQWEFRFPLLTLNQAQQVQNSLMSKLGSGTQVSGQPGWAGTDAPSSTPNSLAAPSAIPAAANTPAAGAAPLTGYGSTLI